MTLRETRLPQYERCSLLGLPERYEQRSENHVAGQLCRATCLLTDSLSFPTEPHRRLDLPDGGRSHRRVGEHQRCLRLIDRGDSHRLALQQLVGGSELALSHLDMGSQMLDGCALPVVVGQGEGIRKQLERRSCTTRELQARAAPTSLRTRSSRPGLSFAARSRAVAEAAATSPRTSRGCSILERRGDRLVRTSCC